MKRIYILSLLAMAILVSCGPAENKDKDPWDDHEEQPGGGEEGGDGHEGIIDKHGFDYRIDIEDGILSSTTVVRPAKVAFTVISEDESANYTLDYTVNGGEPRHVRLLWAGKQKDLSADFSAYDSYGKYVIEGDLYDEDDESNKVHLRETLWMKYSKATVLSVMAETEWEEYDLSEPASIAVGNVGNLILTYSPSDTYLNIEPEWDPKGPVALFPERATNASGVYSIPFRVTGEGDATVSLLTENGEERLNHACYFRCVKPEFCFSASWSGFALSGSGTHFVISFPSDAPSGEAEMSYSVDGKLAYGETIQVLPNASYRKYLRLEEPLEGTHQVTVTIQNPSRPNEVSSVTEEVSFSVPVLQLREAEHGTSSFAPGDTVGLELGYDYAFSVTGLPDEWIAKSRLVSRAETDVITGKASGTIRAMDVTSEPLALFVSDFDNPVTFGPVTRYWTAVCDLWFNYRSSDKSSGLAVVFSTKATPADHPFSIDDYYVDISAQMRYHGECGPNKYGDWTTTYSGSVPGDNPTRVYHNLKKVSPELFEMYETVGGRVEYYHPVPDEFHVDLRLRPSSYPYPSETCRFIIRCHDYLCESSVEGTVVVYAD